MTLFLPSIFIYIDAKVFSIYKKTILYDFHDVNLVVAIETLKVNDRNFALRMGSW